MPLLLCGGQLNLEQIDLRRLERSPPAEAFIKEYWSVFSAISNSPPSSGSRFIGCRADQVFSGAQVSTKAGVAFCAF